MNSASQTSLEKLPEVNIRLLREEDLPAADRIMRLAFGTFLGLPDPLKFMGDAEYVRTRWPVDPSAAFAADLSGELVGTNFATRWGSFGFFGPLTIRPDLWDRGIAQKLLAPTMNLFDAWGVTHAGLFTFASSTKHVNLYQKFGFWPRFLTSLMSLPIDENPSAGRRKWLRFSDLSESEKEECLQACRELTNSIYEGLEVDREIRAVDSQTLGDTVLTWDSGKLAGFAVCHVGAKTEAGSGKCYIKFGAVQSGQDGALLFRRLLDACREFAQSRGTKSLVAGVNLARADAYREMLQAGFRATAQGVAMERNGDAGYNRHDVFVMDDWR
ncbi:MAG TPA: GNAT family N-acetyltransferase [Candidatus Acidoferrales bacterium]|jgi:GNAT superfamily N-acetyltransferase|nr:GNAT family N-acetyltransferase [Candidatus Acidoferrales bacterium]